QNKSFNLTRKFALAFWKTLNIQKSYKLTYAKIFLISLVFLPILALLRAITEPEVNNKIIYDPVEIDSLDELHATLAKLDRNSSELVQKLYYTPRYPPFEKIIEKTVKRLKLKGYNDVADDTEMEKLMQKTNYLAGVKFLGATKNITKMPDSLDYELRFPPVLRTSPHPKHPLHWQTKSLFPHRTMRSEMRKTNYTGVPPGYFEEGFVQLQHAIAMSFLELKSGQEDLTKVGVPKMIMRSFPVRRLVQDLYKSHLKILLPITILFTYAFPSIAIVKAITDENERGIMKMMRIEELNWLAWVSIIGLSQIMSSVLILSILTPSWGSHAVFEYSSWPVVLCFLICYVCANCSFILMISVVVVHKSRNAKYALIIRLFTIAPYPFILVFYHKISTGYKLLACLSHDSALALGLNIILEFESSGEGFAWKNFNMPHFAGDVLCCSHVCAMLLLDSILYMLILVYQHYKVPPEMRVMQVDKQMVAKKWYYPLEALNKRIQKRKEKAIVNEDLFDNENGIQVLKVTKTVGDTDYLKDITMIIHPNEITVILHQKCDNNSMLLSNIISGDVPMTSGRVIINGHDVEHYTGTDTLCTILPTESIVFTQLTTTENLYFYMHLRGMRNYRQIMREILKYLSLMKMDIDEAECLTDHMSFGQARCLSVCCALCGGNHAVIVEDPSQGLTQLWKHRMWDLLKHAGRSRVLIVNTPHSDEAECLGDRIAVVYCGLLQCYDRNKSLHDKYCNNYNLYGEVVRASKKNDHEFVKLLSSYFPTSAYVIRMPSSGKLDVTLPMGFELRLADLLADLEAKATEMGLGRIWVKTHTLRDVFMKDLLHINEQIQDKEMHELLERCCSRDLREGDQFRRTVLQFSAFMHKKLIQLYRFYWLPIILMVLLSLCVFFNVQSSHFSHLPLVNITLTTYPHTVVLMDRLELTKEMVSFIVTDCYESHHRRICEGDPTGHKFTYLLGRRDIESYLIFLQMVSRLRVETFYVVGADVDSDSIVCYWNNMLVHAAPISLNMMHNALAIYFIGPHSEIRLVNHPITFSNKIILEEYTIHSSMTLGLGNLLIMVLCVVIALMVVPLISEFTTGNRRVIYLSGGNMTMYWVSHMLADMLVFTVVITYLVVLLVVHDIFLNADKRNYDDGLFVLHVFLVLFLFGFAVLPFVYLLAALFARIFFGFVMTLFILFSTSVLIMLVIQLTEQQSSDFVYTGLFWSPTMNMYRALRNLHVNRALRRACEQMGGCAAESACCHLVAYAGYKYPGIFTEIILLAVQQISYGALLVIITRNPFIIEDFFFRMRQRCKKTTRSIIKGTMFGFNTVLEERERIDNMTRAELKEHAVVFRRVSKRARGNFSVSDVSFVVEPNEVFALVGPRHSGKSEIIRMTVGAESISSGDIFVRGISVRNQPKDTYGFLAYCPGGNSLFGYLTVHEILRFYSLLNGCKREFVSQVIDHLCRAVDLDKYMHTLISHLGYSQRRQLTVGISVLSGSNTVVMEEPTRGMARGSKAITGQLIRMLKVIGRTVVIATEDFDEAVELCDCIAFIASGTLRSIGTLDHLTSLHSRGCIVELKLAKVIYTKHRRADTFLHLLGVNHFYEVDSSVSEDDGPHRPSDYSFSSNENDAWLMKAMRYQDVEAFMEAELPFAEQRNSYDEHPTYYLPFEDIALSSVFRAMVAVKEALNVESYRITCTSVAEIY
ncbi:hypothetical protein KR093_010369, partial [Drosophila rubida]